MGVMKKAMVAGIGGAIIYLVLGIIFQFILKMTLPLGGWPFTTVMTAGIFIGTIEAFISFFIIGLIIAYFNLRPDSAALTGGLIYGILAFLIGVPIGMLTGFVIGAVVGLAIAIVAALTGAIEWFIIALIIKKWGN